ncbi:hypothetical protein GGR57DRAFT_499333 [Xylariaceae sp. FL1272]|nr:hypothetical protein GGR57DRAFT_499333 [Xylariaceae sp. FL1272]
MREISLDVTKSFYPRLVLFEALAGFKDEHERRPTTGDAMRDACRQFLDHFAYLCDVRKGGATVTAAALQRLRKGNVLWLAANEGISWEVKVYANSILQMLQSMNAHTESEIREQIFHHAVKMCMPRLEFYKTQLKLYATRCRMELRKLLPEERVISLRRALKILSEPPRNLDMSNLIERCYGMRGDQIDTIRKMSTHSQGQDDFGRLAHFIGRLGATRFAVDSIVRTTSQAPDLRRISVAHALEAPSLGAIRLNLTDMSPYEIVRQVCDDSSARNERTTQLALHAIVDLDLPSYRNLDDSIRARLANRSPFETRVHAELQIADHFSRRGYEFVGSDKYIGCSKPACYFCYNWLGYHKHNYVQPATHQKIIPMCRGPDIDINESGANILKEMYSKMTQGVSQDIIDFLLEGTGNKPTGRRYQFQSTEGTTPSTISSQVI